MNFTGGGYGRIPANSCCPDLLTWPFALSFIAARPNRVRSRSKLAHRSTRFSCDVIARAAIHACAFIRAGVKPFSPCLRAEICMKPKTSRSVTAPGSPRVSVVCRKPRHSHPGTSVPLRGVPHRIVHRAGVRGTVWPEMRDSGDKILCVAGDSEFIDRRVHDFLKREARRALTEASHRYAEELGVKVKRITIRDQSSRWGSCTSAGALSFSWRLILAPPYVLDYLAAHEVAHLVEMNHSPRFWKVVAKICPATERANRMARHSRQ